MKIAGLYSRIKGNSSVFYGGAVILTASMLANLCNFLYNFYLAQSSVISLEEFGVISLIGSFLNILQIPLSAYSRAITHQTAFWLGKHGKPATYIWKKLRKASIKPSLIVSGLWLISIPLLGMFFHTDRLLPFVLLTPLWLVGIAQAVDSGFLNGSHAFSILGIMTVSEVAVKFLLTVLLVKIGLEQWFYLSIPVSTLFSFFIGWICSVRIARKNPSEVHSFRVPRRFFISSLLTKLSSIIFLNVDVLLAKHYLTPHEAGSYAILSMVGKINFFFGVLLTQLLNPLVSKREGQGKESRSILIVIMSLTILLNVGAWIFFGLFHEVTLPMLHLKGLSEISDHVSLYTFAMSCIAVAGGIISYYQSKERHVYAVMSFLLSLCMILGVVIWHATVGDIAFIVSTTGIMYLVGTLLVGKYYQTFDTLIRNIQDFIEVIFGFIPERKEQFQKSILILNWRDTKHIWAGGSEVYLHQVAKRLVSHGYSVTMFCGNDQRNPRNEIIDGVQMVRRGGFYTVYLWAIVYYVIRFRGLFDVIIDTENGIPFFSPLYARVPVILQIHHVHQDVFKQHLIFPLSTIAMFLERRVMPWMYRKAEVITVSQSSLKEIVKNGFATIDRITVVEPGITTHSGVKFSKTRHPSILYLGRLKSYKNIDTLLHAFANVVKQIPDAHLTIAGSGEEFESLKKLARKLNIYTVVSFSGYVSEEKKQSLLATHWIAVQPSSVEGWGITVIEANTFGTPVIGSRVNGLKDSIIHNKTGILISPKNVNELTSAIQLLLTNHSKRKLFQKNAAEWAQKFNWEERVEKIITIIERTHKARRFSATSEISLEGGNI